MSTHASENDLCRFFRGEATPQEAETIANHVQNCEICEGVLAEIDRLSEIGGYTVSEFLGRGGMANVWLVTDQSLRRDVAFKVLKEEYKNNTDLRNRFVEEAHIAGQLQHAGIAPVHQRGHLPDGRPYLVMKQIKGTTLAVQLTSRPDGERQLSRFLPIFENICRTVAFAHDHRVIHRDLKPDNVMVSGHGEVQVMDWGLAKVLPPDWSADRAQPTSTTASDYDQGKTRAGTVINSPRGKNDSWTHGLLGTLPYMPPEQAREKADLQDTRSDVFSLGAILCEILTGLPPYISNKTNKSEVRIDIVHEVQLGHLEGAHARIDACSADPELKQIAKQCLQKERDARPPHAGVVAEAVTAYLAGLESKRRTAELNAVRLRWRLGMAASLALFLAIAIAIWIWYREHDRFRRSTLAASEANELRMRGRWSETITKLDESLTLGHPDPVRIRLDRFLAYQAVLRIEDAGKELKALEEVRGKYAGEILLWRGEDLILASQVNDGRSLVRQALEAGLPASLREYAESLLATNAETAEAHLRKSVALDPYLIEPQRHLCFVLLVSGRWEEFDRQSEFSSQRFPDDIGFPTLRAIGLGIRGDKDRAMLELQRLAGHIDDKTIQMLTVLVENLVIVSRYMDHWPGGTPEISQAMEKAVSVLLQQADATGNGGSDVRTLLHVPPSVRLAIMADQAKFTKPAAIPALAIDVIKEFWPVYPDGLFAMIRGMDYRDVAESERQFRRAMEAPSIIPNVQREAAYGATMIAVYAYLQGDDDGINRSVGYLRRRLEMGPLRDDQAESAVRLLDAWRGNDLKRKIITVQLERHPKDPSWLRHRAIADFWDGRWQAAIETSEAMLLKNPDDCELRLIRAEAVLAAEMFVAGVKEPTVAMVRKALGETPDAVVLRADALAGGKDSLLESGDARSNVRMAAQLYSLAASACRDEPARRDSLLELSMKQLRRLAPLRLFRLEKKSLASLHGFHLLEQREEYRKIISESEPPAPSPKPGA